MIELTIMGSKSKAGFMVDKIVVTMLARTGGTAIFTVEGAEWVVTESLGVVLAMIGAVKGG